MSLIVNFESNISESTIKEEFEAMWAILDELDREISSFKANPDSLEDRQDALELDEIEYLVQYIDKRVPRIVSFICIYFHERVTYS